MVVSAVLGVYSLARLDGNATENERLTAAIQERQNEIAGFKEKGEKVQQLLTPEQRAMLSASHKLVANKTFGWSRLFADLESVMPGSVSASRISVDNIYLDGERIRAELEFAVLSKDYQSVMAMIENMNNSGHFQAQLRGQDLQKNERITYTEYTFRLIYTPGYGYAAAPDVAMNGQGGTQ